MASILITDDEPSIRKLLGVMLKDAGHIVYQASNGVEAMRILDAKKIDIMIIDIVMPEKGGIETIMQVRENHPDLDLIVVSGKVSIENDAFQNLIKQYRVYKVFDKPFEKEDIFSAVEELAADKV
jgi:DNA-binding NtrC family response regulator